MAESIVGLKKALPYLRLFRKKIFVLKIGGEVLSDQAVLGHFAEQVALLYQVGILVVVVHGVSTSRPVTSPAARSVTSPAGQSVTSPAARSRRQSA